MWSIFSRDPVKDFAYEIGELVGGLEGKSVWTLHKGKKKATGEPVSIFSFDVKASSESQVQIAKGAFKRIKTLRHPNILTFLDGIETDKIIYIATEPVIPLEAHLQNLGAGAKQKDVSIAWGLHQIVKGLSFLVNDCGLIHNNVCMSSVFVDQAGEWQLAGVDYMYPAQGQESVPPIKILPLLDIYDPPEKSDLKRGMRGKKWSSDMWGLGCLIWEIFNGHLKSTSSLKSFGKIPKSLVPNYCEVVGANPSSRPNPATFVENCRKPGGFMNNSFVDTMFFLEEIQIKDQAEKTKFFSGLASSLDTFPDQICRHKILPQLLHAFEYGNAGSSVLAPLFKLGRLLDADEYQKKIVPCVVKLFSSSDRSTRVKLLQQIESFIEHLQSSTVNDQIFPHIVHGFMDTNPVVRESTVKAMIHMSSKLNYKHLNEDLMKHFARLQSKDDQGGIRANTTVCLGKIACYLNPQIRQKLLVSAFLRAIKDPFPAARQAGILGMAATQNFYLLNDMAVKLLPALCSMVMDPEKVVRDQAFKAIKGFLAKLEQVSENPELASEMEKDVMTGGTPATGAASWAGWAVTGVSSLTSKIYSKAARGKPPEGPASPLSGTALHKEPNNMGAPAPASTVTPQEPAQPLEETNYEEEEEEEEDKTEGWDEDWGDIDTSPVSSPTSSNVPQAPVENMGGGSSGYPGAQDWDNDEDWGSLEESGPSKSADEFKNKHDNPRGSLKLGGGQKTAQEWGDWGDDDFQPTHDSGLAPASNYNWGAQEDVEGDFFSEVLGGPKKSSSKPRKSPPRQTSAQTAPATMPVEKKQGVAAQKPVSQSTNRPGWDDEEDWGGDGGWGDDFLGSGFSNPAEAQKKKREEERRQRQKEMTEKREARKGAGALKLGAKKLGAD